METTVLFDLDGTLLDTERDFTQVLNNQLASHGLAPASALDVRRNVSNGARALVSLGFGIDESDSKFEAYLNELLDRYEMRIAQTESVLFPGIANLLRALDKSATAWGIVTNKPSRFTDPLLESFNTLETSQVVICPDHVSNSKPDPEGILLACSKLSCDPGQVLYVGDHPKDVQAASAAGAVSIGVRWGYIPVDHPIETWNADIVINHPDEILNHLLKQ